MSETSRDAGGTVLYEVTLDVEAEVAGAFAEWLAGHIDEMLDLPGFRSAAWWREASPDAPPATDPGATRWVVQYRLADRAALDVYLRDHAPRMRQGGIDRFDGRFTATRRVLELVDGKP